MFVLSPPAPIRWGEPRNRAVADVVALGDFPHRFLVFVAPLDRLSDLVRSEFRLATQPHAPRFGAFPAFSATWSRRRGFDHVLLAGKVKLCGLACRAMRQRLDSATC